MRIIRIKDGVVLSTKHWAVSQVSAIIKAVDIVFPKDSELIITRGCEDAVNGKRTSKHLPPICAAFDFRTRHLPVRIDRNLIVSRLKTGLGPEYYVYFGEVETEKSNIYPRGMIEWIHAQWNGGNS